LGEEIGETPELSIGSAYSQLGVVTPPVGLTRSVLQVFVGLLEGDEFHLQIEDAVCDSEGFESFFR
jgi:hypothetical protein